MPQYPEMQQQPPQLMNYRQPPQFQQNQRETEM